MTAEPITRSYVFEGQGQQVNAEHVDNMTINVTELVRGIVKAHALGDTIGALLETYVWTDSATQATSLLHTRNSIALTGPRGSGRWSTAVAVIDKLGATPHRIDLDPEDTRRDLPAEPGCGYIMDIDEKTSNEIPALGEMLADYGARLADANAFLVVTATSAVWAPIQGRTLFGQVAVSPAPAMEIFRKHLARTHPAGVPNWAWDSKIAGLLEDANPADAVRLASLVHDVVSAGSDDPVRDTVDAYGNWSVHLAEWFGKNSDPYHRALLIAAAALGETRTETVFDAASLLTDLAGLERKPGGGLAGDGVTGLIGTIEAKETVNGRIRLRRAAYSESVLNLVWRERPHLRAGLRQWLTDLPGASSLHDPATENAGHSLIDLAIRQSDDVLIRTAASSWATGGQANLAAVALTRAALSTSIGRPVRRQLYTWADRANTNTQLKLTIAAVCGGPFGRSYPRNAMTRLRRLAIRSESDVWDQVAVAIQALAGEPHLRVFALREVIRWLADDRLRNAGIRAFLTLAVSLADQLAEPPGQEVHGLLAAGWQAALHDPESAETAYQGCGTWLEAVAQERAPRETVLTILADTCQNTRDIGTLCTMATRWSRDYAEPTAVSRDEVLFAFLRQIGDRDPLTPGLTPAPIHLSAEENDQ